MSGIIHFLSPLVHPLGVGWLLLAIATAVAARRRHVLGTTAGALAVLVVWMLGQPRITRPIYSGLERPWLTSSLASAPVADAVIVLGGGWRPSRPELNQLDFTDAADRLVAGIDLCRRGRAPVLVLGGDPVTGSPAGTPSSIHIQQWLRDWGVHPAEVLSLGPVRNTTDEAEGARKLVAQRGWKKVLLVTSALHMRRAVATFEKVGVPVHPVACDFRFATAPAGTDRWMAFPDSESFLAFGTWWHEQLGWIAYRALGRI